MGISGFRIWPNPVSAPATVEYQLDRPGLGRLELFNLAGQLVEVLVNKHLPAGGGSITWDGERQPSGMYICTLKAGGEVIHRKIILSP